MKLIVLLSAVVLAGVAASAGAAGPAPGAASGLTAGDSRWTAEGGSGETLVRRADAGRRIAGSWGFPRIARDGTVGGLSPDRRTLVLVPQTHGQLATPTRFALLDPETLATRRMLSIPGRFAFDALSPDAAKLYLIEYVTVVGRLRYRVRSYDVAAGRLDKRVIADKRSGWTAMEGESLSRATSPDGSWAYTLYGSDSRVFVHALQTVAGYAVCIDLPVEPALAAGLRLRLAGTRLSLVTRSGALRAEIDTTRLRVVRSTLAHG